jgi:hypothetical protein
MEKFCIIRDTREKKEHGWFFEEDAYCQGTEISKIKYGDYCLKGYEDFFVIERKMGIDEFAHNCVETRFKVLIDNLIKSCKHIYLIFEFTQQDVDDYPESSNAPKEVKSKLKIRAKFIRMHIRALRQRGIHILFCEDRMKAEKIAYRLLKKAHEIRCKQSR